MYSIADLANENEVS